MTVTEIATIPLVPNSTISDKNTPAGKIWHDVLATVARQDGVQDMRYGQRLEDASVVQLFVEWDTIDSHKRFIASPDYNPMLRTLSPLQAGAINLLHYPFTTRASLAHALRAPVTEAATFYLRAPSTSFVTALLGLRSALEKRAEEGYLGFAYGWSVEGVEHEGFGEGVEGKGCMVVIGWVDREAHMAFRETEGYRKAVEGLMDEPEGVEMHHVAVRGFE